MSSNNTNNDTYTKDGKHPSTDTVYDVIVVGAGLSGLSAARYIQQHANSKQLTYLVLDARDRVGGRTYTVKHKTPNSSAPSHTLDCGGAYAGPTQNRLLRMLSEFGIQTEKVYNEGRTVMKMNDHRQSYIGEIPSKLSPFALLDTNNAVVQTEKLRQQVNVDEPHNSPPHIKQLDTMTVAEWLRKHSWCQSAIEVYAGSIRGLLCVETSQVSMLAWLWYVQSAFGFNRITGVTNAAQERYIVGGAQTLSDKLRDAVGEYNVVLNSAVQHIDHRDTNDTVVLTCRDGTVYQAKNVILAMSPLMYSYIQYTPLLPALKSTLAQRLPMGCIIKTHMQYKRPFWRQLGYNGIVFCDHAAGPVSYSYDNCHSDTEGNTYIGLMGFCYSSSAIQYGQMTAEQRQLLICQQYSELFQCDDAMHPVDYVEYNWNTDEYSRGCYVGTCGPDVLTQLGPQLRTSISDRVYVAGTESAVYWSGYMSGAIEAGERASHEILCQLGILQTPFDPLEPTCTTTDVECYPCELEWWQHWLPNVPQAATVLGVIALTCVTLLVRR